MVVFKIITFDLLVIRHCRVNCTELYCLTHFGHYLITFWTLFDTKTDINNMKGFEKLPKFVNVLWYLLCSRHNCL